MKVLLFALGILAACVATNTPAAAQNYPWCALYSGGSVGGGRNCGFTTYEQCLATVSGIGGSCFRNTQYDPPGGPRPKAKYRQYPN
jgi:hypothetical protein